MLIGEEGVWEDVNEAVYTEMITPVIRRIRVSLMGNVMGYGLTGLSAIYM